MINITDRVRGDEEVVAADHRTSLVKNGAIWAVLNEQILNIRHKASDATGAELQGTISSRGAGARE